jgi:hypothetical protein
MPGNRSRRSHLRTDEVRSSAFPLPAFKISVRRARTPLSRHQDIRIHTEAHTTSSLAPLKAGGAEDVI